MRCTYPSLTRRMQPTTLPMAQFIQEYGRSVSKQRTARYNCWTRLWSSIYWNGTIQTQLYATTPFILRLMAYDGSHPTACLLAIRGPTLCQIPRPAWKWRRWEDIWKDQWRFSTSPSPAILLSIAVALVVVGRIWFQYVLAWRMNMYQLGIFAVALLWKIMFGNSFRVFAVYCCTTQYTPGTTNML